MEDFGALAAYAVFFVLPIFLAHLRGRRWWVWAIPCLVFGPFTLPFIAMRPKPKEDLHETSSEMSNIVEEHPVPHLEEADSASVAVRNNARRYSRLELGLICWLLGLLGVHRFLIGRWKTGLMMLLTFGALGVWTLIDLIRIIANRFNYVFEGTQRIQNATQDTLVEIHDRVGESTESVVQEPELADGESETFFIGTYDAPTEPEMIDSNQVIQEVLEVAPQDTEKLSNSIQESDEEINKDSDAETNSESSNFLLGLKFTLSGARRTKKNRQRLVELQNYIEATKGAEANFRNEFNQVLATNGLDSNAETVLFEVGNCYLIEVRKGARVTHRESSSSGSGGGASVGFGGVRVGGGSYGSSSSSTTISYPAPDVLKTIDQGKCIITNRKISFVGGMFTKTTAFSKIVDYQSSDHQLLIAPVTGTKVWICEFPRIDMAWMASIIIRAALDTDNRLLDSKAITIYESAINLLTAEFNRQCMEIQLAIESFEEEIEKVQIQFSELEEAFGSLASWKRRGFA